MILITPLSAVDQSIHRYRPSHIVTLLAPDHMIAPKLGFAPDRHLRLALEDVSDSWLSNCPPCSSQVENLIEFGRGWKCEAPLLVHCWAGVSRSTAAAYILLCDKVGPGRELELARALRNRAPHACPNRLMIQLADDAMGRNGRMVSAIEAIGRGTIVAEGCCVELPVSLEALAISGD
ncbi:MAG TPA: hypothetical protein VGM17_18055 [Rhizomicrobium sp.]|jgi:predicted protein tyrosine phosphatase